MKIDVDQHEKQLDLLGYDRTESIFYRLIPGSGYKGNTTKRKLSRDKLKPLEIIQGDMVRGLYFVVNGGGDTDEEVANCRAFFAEWDDRSLEEQKTLWKTKHFLEPTFQVRTRKSIHCYWVLETPMASEDWRILQANLLNVLDADRTLKNPSRVLRVAGSWHVKANAEPVQCQLINVTGYKYSQADIEAALQQAEPPKLEPSKPITNGHIPPIPLERCLPHKQRDLIKDGAKSGGRNVQGFGLAKDLLATEEWLQRNSIPYSDSAESLFLDYCRRCDPTDWTEREWQSVWQSAKSAPRIEPPLPPDAIENCRRKWAKENGVKYQVETSRPLSSPQAETSEESDPGVTYTEKALRDLYNHGGHYAALDGVLYKFNGKFYEQLYPELEKLRIREWAQGYAVWNGNLKKNTYPYTTPRSVNSIWEWALISFAVSPNRVNPPGLNLANGVLKISWEGRKPSWELLPHSPENVYLYCSDVNYNPDADPEHCDRLLACLDPAPRTALLRTIAAALDLPTVRKLYSRGVRAGILRGAGSNGKDSLREAVSLIFGDSMVSVELSDFKAYDDGRKFYLAPLKHALVNWSSENNKGTSLDGLDSLNVCVTGERGGIKIEEKNKQPRPFTPQAIHLFNVNKIPRISSGLDSILSRFAIYDFNKTFKNNPDPVKGELQADPRFHDDPVFMSEQVCPAFLNRLLVELVNFCKEGIDYDSLKASLDDIQEESTHLWQFVRETGLTQDAGGRVYVHDLWEALRHWYIDNGTLEVLELDNGKQKNIWNDQANKWDANVTGPNQVYKRFKLLFPKIERERETQDPENKGRWFFSGVSFNTPNSASPASLPYTASIPASPSGSLCFTSLSSASPEGSEAKSEANEASSEAETRSMTSGEASEAKNRDLSYSAEKNGNGKKTPGLIYSDDEILVHMVNFEKVALGWTSEQLRDFVKAEFGGSAWVDLSESQKINLVYKLRAIYSASPN